MTAPESILNFVGYGSLDAPLWFIGMEESVGARDTVPNWSHRWETDVRQTWPSVMDARLAHEQLRDPYWTKAGITSVWINAARLARGLLDDAADWNDLALAKSYVRESLGRSTGGTLLGELLPLPKKRLAQWPDDYSGWYQDIEQYESQVRPSRQAMWSKLISKHKPKYVCFYGTGSNESYWGHYRDLFENAHWRVLLPGKGRKKGVRTADVASTRCYLLPFFDSRHLRNEDLAAVIDSLR